MHAVVISDPTTDASLWQQCLALARARRLGQASRWRAARAAVDQLASADAPPWLDLLAPVLHRAAGSAPWCIGQLGQSLDGYIATRTGDACSVNDRPVLEHLHRLRALCDAIVVGAGTVAADDPQLTTRRVAGDHPVRVILDPELRLTSRYRVFQDGAAPTLLACDARRAGEAAARLGAERVLAVEGLGLATGAVFTQRLLQALAARGLPMVFVEGGGVTVSQFLRQASLDRLHLSIAPVLIGGGRPGLQLPAHDAMDDCPRPAARLFQLGRDVVWDLDLRSAAQR